jgi:hypothetical protein
MTSAAPHRVDAHDVVPPDLDDDSVALPSVRIAGVPLSRIVLVAVAVVAVVAGAIRCVTYSQAEARRAGDELQRGGVLKSR